MAETDQDVVVISEEEEEEEFLGHLNINEAAWYSSDIEKTFVDLKELLNEDGKDALIVMIHVLKKWMSQLWTHMAEADPNVVLHCIIELSCVTL